MSKVGAFFDLNQDVSLSAGHDRMVVFARRRSGGLAHISEVDNGKACNCACLACDELLIARQGDVREHSFAHQSGSQCHNALDAMMNGVAAMLIERRQRFVTPVLRVEAGVEGPFGLIADTRFQPAVQVPVERVELARQAPWKHSCVVATVKGHTLLIHIALRRPASASKVARLRELGQAAVEVDLSRAAPRTIAELAEILFGVDERKTWLHNPKSAAISADIRLALAPVVAQRWQEHRDALERQRQEELHAASLARRQHEIFLEERKADEEEVTRAAQAEHSSLSRPSKPPKPEELSPSVEYVGTSGSVWLLHSALPDIHFRVEPGAWHELQVLRRYGAIEDTSAGVFRISRAGWASASIELASAWRAVRSVDQPISSD